MLKRVLRNMPSKRICPILYRQYYTISTILRFQQYKSLTPYRIINTQQKSTFTTTKPSNSNYTIQNIELQHLLFIQPSQNSTNLQYLSQVEVQFQSQKGNKYYGIVLNILKDKVVVGLYEKINNQILQYFPHGSHSIAIPAVITPFQGLSNITRNNNVLSVPLKQLNKKKIASNSIKYSNKQHNQKKLYSNVPLLDICYDLKQGTLNIFEGTKGSGRTSTAISIMQKHIKDNSNNYVLYVTLSKSDCEKVSSSLSQLSQQLIVFSQKQFTNTSGCLLLLKAIRMAKQLSKQKNILLVVDGLDNFLNQQWAILDRIGSKLSPFDSINEIYSYSSSYGDHSVTSIVIIQESSTKTLKYPQAMSKQQLSNYSNTIKHLRTLAIPVQFPVQPILNYNYKKSQDSNQSTQIKIRQIINKLIIEQRDHEIKRKLKLDKDQPWQHYFVLDSGWWLEPFTKYRLSIDGKVPIKCKEVDQNGQYILDLSEDTNFNQIGPKYKQITKQIKCDEKQILEKFLLWNIENQLSSQWKKTFNEIFRKFLAYAHEKLLELQNVKQIDNIPSIFVNDDLLWQFFMEAKLDGLVDTFKKDYLA